MEHLNISNLSQASGLLGFFGKLVMIYNLQPNFWVYPAVDIIVIQVAIIFFCFSHDILKNRLKSLNSFYEPFDVLLFLIGKELYERYSFRINQKFGDYPVLLTVIL